MSLAFRLPGRPVEQGRTLAASLLLQVRDAPQQGFTEIDRTGQRRRLTNADILARAKGILPLLPRGSGEPAHLVLGLESFLDFMAATWAAILSGATIHPWHVSEGTSTPAAIERRLDLIRRKLERPVLVSTTRVVGRLGDHLSAFASVIAVDDPGAARVGTADIVETDAPLFLLPTSGTTGTKLAMVPYWTMLRQWERWNGRLGRRAGVSSFPFDSISGFAATLRSGADHAYIQPERLAAQPLDLMQAVTDLKIEAIGLSASMAARILDAIDAGNAQFDLSRLGVIGFGAEMIVPQIVRRAARTFGRLGATNLRVTFGYGMTETGLLARTPEVTVDEALAELGTGEHPPSVGDPQPGWSIRIVGDDGNRLPDGEVGSVEVWSDVRMFAGYYKEPEVNAASFAGDGWFRTGDLGSLTGGRLTIAGREKAIIVINGRKVPLEQIEAPLRQLPGVRGSRIAAVAIRRPESRTDELGIFFVPESQEKEPLAILCRTITRDTAKATGISVRHLVPVAEEEFPATATGKVRRDALAEGYLNGRWAAYRLPVRRPAVPTSPEEIERRLGEIWQAALRLDALPRPEDNFFDLGGDSLASAELMLAVEERFGGSVPLAAFFQNPTVAALSRLVVEGLPKSAASAGSGEQLLHRVRHHVASWRGARLLPDAMVVGMHTTGSRMPVFWVLQQEREFAQMGRALGPDQPFYGMRSLAKTGGANPYSPEAIETITNRYLWEMLALTNGRPMIVGGTCQGAVIALQLARKLRQVGRAPALLAFLEANVFGDTYPDHTLFIYAEQSYTAATFGTPQTAGPDWQGDFPSHTVVSIPGHHNDSTSPENSARFAAIIGPYTATPPAGGPPAMAGPTLPGAALSA